MQVQSRRGQRSICQLVRWVAHVVVRRSPSDGDSVQSYVPSLLHFLVVSLAEESFPVVVAVAVAVAVVAAAGVYKQNNFLGNKY